MEKIICEKCKKEIKEGSLVCGFCGAAVPKEKLSSETLNNSKENETLINLKEIESGKLMGILSYIFPPVPFIVEKNNKFVIYHAKRGMNLLVLSIAYGIIYGVLTSLIKVRSCGSLGALSELADAFGTCPKITPWWVTLPLSLVGLGLTALCVIGIINVCNGKTKELPIVDKIKIFK